MSLHPEPIGTIPAETARVARAAFPKGTVVMRPRDEFGALYGDEDFGRLYPSRGQPALTPWRLALVTVFQFLENLSDRQAADAVRARIDWKYALGLELTDPGFHFSVLTEFRARLVAGGAEPLLLDTMLERFKARALEVGADGFVLLDALDAPDAPAAARALPMVRTLRDVWRVHYARDDDGRLRWCSVAELPPVAERVQSPYDPEAHFSLKGPVGWTGYKVHVTEACEDDAAHLITPVMSRPAMRPDRASTAEIHERLAAKGLLPSE